MSDTNSDGINDLELQLESLKRFCAVPGYAERYEVTCKDVPALHEIIVPITQTVTTKIDESLVATKPEVTPAQEIVQVISGKVSEILKPVINAKVEDKAVNTMPSVGDAEQSKFPWWILLLLLWHVSRKR